MFDPRFMLCRNLRPQRATQVQNKPQNTSFFSVFSGRLNVLSKLRRKVDSLWMYTLLQGLRDIEYKSKAYAFHKLGLVFCAAPFLQKLLLNFFRENFYILYYLFDVFFCISFVYYKLVFYVALLPSLEKIRLLHFV